MLHKAIARMQSSSTINPISQMSEININYKFKKKTKQAPCGWKNLGNPTGIPPSCKAANCTWNAELGLDHCDLEKNDISRNYSNLDKTFPFAILSAVSIFPRIPRSVWCADVWWLPFPRGNMSKACLGLLCSTTDCSHLKSCKKEFGISFLSISQGCNCSIWGLRILKFRTPEAETCRK